MGKNTQLGKIFKFSAPMMLDVASSHLTTALILSMLAKASENSLAAYGTANTIFTLISAFLAIVTIAPPILISRIKAKGDIADATEITGNSVSIILLPA